MTQYSVNERQFQGINRTICIGLGGTGRDVLMRIRRLIVDRYGDLANLPIVSFVHIDTDSAASQAAGLRTGNTYHGVDLSFRDSEKVGATMTSTEVTNFVQGVERRKDSDRPSPYDHIKRWFPPQLLRNIKAVEEGAKGIRPVGRLAFFHNYRKIRAAIETAEQRTRGHEGTLVRSGLRVDPGVNIFIVGSLCGGTGSGMFLDVAYSLRRIYGDSGAQIVGYFVVSPQLYGNAPNMNANTYAALKELNHYTTPGTRFEACYDMQDLVFVQEDRPPFEYTYLVSNQTPGEYAILEQRKLCNVIAHKIALDFSGELAPVVKGMRDNFLQYLINWDNHPRPNPQRYLTFGLAAIYFPRDRIVQIALNRLCFQLVNFWLNGQGQSPDPQSTLEQFLIQNNWHNDLSQKEGINNRLAEAVSENNKNFTSTLSTWRNKLDATISETKKKDDRLALRQQLAREFRQQFRKVQPGETESIRGILLTKLQQVRPGVTNQLIQDIDNFLSALLTPSNSNFSIKTSRDFLAALLTELNQYEQNTEERIRTFNGYKTQENIDKKWRDIEQVIEDLEQKLDFPGLGNKNREIQKEAKQGVRKVTELIKHNFDLAVHQEALQIIKTLEQHVQNLSTQIAGFSRVVDNLRSEYEKNESILRQLNADEMSGEAIFSDEDIEDCCQKLLPQQDSRSQLAAISVEITEPAGRGRSLAPLIIKERISEGQLKDEIRLPVERLFGARSSNIVKSVIRRFMQNYTTSERSIRLSQIMQEAEPLLRLNFADPYFRQSSAKRSKLIGFKDTDDAEVQQFKNLLTQDLGVPSHVLKATQTDNEILIVNEYAAFPLRLISGLEGMRAAYELQGNRDGSLLHNDYSQRFTDIIPPEARIMEELEDIFYPCLAFNLLQQQNEQSPLEFQYYDSLRDSYYTASLSHIWNQALETLATRPDMVKALQELLNNAIAQIENQDQRWDSYYLPQLRAFVDKVDNLSEDDPNAMYRFTVVGTPGTMDTPPKEGVINRFRRRLQEKVQFSQQQRALTSSTVSAPQTPQKTLTPEIIDTEYTDSVSHSPSNGDPMAQLRELAQMKREGLLSDEEFQLAKQKILGS